MRIYAVIDSKGLIVNTIVWDGIAEFTPPEGQSVVKLPDDFNGGIGWSYIDEKFIPPPIEEASKEDLIGNANATKQSLLDYAAQKIAPLQDAVDLDMATDDEKTQLTAWKKYRVLVNRVDTSTAPNITWPTSPDDESTTSTSTDTTTGDATTS